MNIFHFICLFSLLQLCSGFNITKKLEKISKHCMTTAERQEMLNLPLGFKALEIIAPNCIYVSIETIGLMELRKMLGFGPIGPWKPRNFVYPSEKELNRAKTLEDYFNLKEPDSFRRSATNGWVVEENVPFCMKFMNKKFPSILEIFKKSYAEIWPSNKDLDRETIDKLVKEYEEISNEIIKAARRIRDVEDCKLDAKRKRNQ